MEDKEKGIKQEEKSDCCAAVAAMLTGTSLKEFKEMFGPTPDLGYWNGYKIYDPSKKVKNGRDIRSYDVVRVVYFTENGVTRKEKRKKSESE